MPNTSEIAGLHFCCIEFFFVKGYMLDAFEIPNYLIKRNSRDLRAYCAGKCYSKHFAMLA